MNGKGPRVSLLGSFCRAKALAGTGNQHIVEMELFATLERPLR